MNQENKEQLPSLEEIIKFLLGEGSLQGYSFGDYPQPINGAIAKKYWWRGLLRKAWEAKSQPAQPHKGLAKEIAKIIEPYCFRELSGSELQSDDYAITTQRKQQEGAIFRAEKFLKAYNTVIDSATPTNEHDLVKEVEEHIEHLNLQGFIESWKTADLLEKCKQALSAPQKVEEYIEVPHCGYSKEGNPYLGDFNQWGGSKLYRKAAPSTPDRGEG